MRASRVALSCLLVSLAGIACSRKETSAPSATASAPVVASAPAPSGPKVDSMTFPVLGPMPIPENNPQTPEKIALGQQLFFDKRLSVDGSRSCYSCHLNEDGTGGHLPTAIGAKEVKLTRHSPVLWNVGYLPRLYWDGRADSLEAQALAAWAGGNMGVGKDKLEAKAKEIAKVPGYKEAFAKVFPDRGVTPETIVQAIAAYERTLVCDDTRYDRYAKGDKNALDEREKQGLELFMGKAGCAACHAPPHFSTAYVTKDGTYFNTGIGTRDKNKDEVDVGRMAVTKNEADWAAFKPPSLRNVAKSPPYFHDGSIANLEEAVRFMASGGYANEKLSPLMVDRKLTDAEISALVAFLRALDCPGSLVEPTLP
ncbi:MAG: cytochrome c peroxidase [Pseudomonadota bacterium]